MFDECFQDVFLYCRSKAEGGMEIPSRTPQTSSSSSETPHPSPEMHTEKGRGKGGWVVSDGEKMVEGMEGV